MTWAYDTVFSSGENCLGARRNLAPRNCLLFPFKKKKKKKKSIANCFKINIHLLHQNRLLDYVLIKHQDYRVIVQHCVERPSHSWKKRITSNSCQTIKKFPSEELGRPWCLWAGSWHTFVPLLSTSLMVKGSFILIGHWNLEGPIWETRI